MRLLVGKTGVNGSKWQSLYSNIKSKYGVHIDSCQHIYIIDGYERLDSSTQQMLQDLLKIDKVYDADIEHDILVLPRKGTTSPWASKVSDILSQLGVSGVGRLEKGVCYKASKSIDNIEPDILQLLHDKMTESVFSINDLSDYWSSFKEQSFKEINILEQGDAPLKDINIELGLSLSSNEIDNIYTHYKNNNRNPTDVELMTFAQVNSEHCRHKIFNAKWIINGLEQKHTLFDLIRLTTDEGREDILSAYSDNAAVMRSSKSLRLIKYKGKYEYKESELGSAIKVETHNHPTAVSPYEGAATGVGGEIRDEAACGIGAKTKAGLCGFSVSSLCIPEADNSYDLDIGTAPGKSSAFKIMQSAPIGSSRYSNEFGRPNVLGYFRSYCEKIEENVYSGYHKPVMLAGGIANIDRSHVYKKAAKLGDCIIVLGGPGFLIGMGGGSASSSSSGESTEDLDFSSVQRGNPELQRRAQEVIDTLCAMGDENPIISIHDVGAGGLSNAVPEIVYQSGFGASINIRAIDIADSFMSPMEIWCNESQERYVMLVNKDHLSILEQTTERENCPYSVIGVLTESKEITVEDPVFENTPLSLDLNWLFKSSSDKTIEINTNKEESLLNNSINTKKDKGDFTDIAKEIIGHPTVASKKYLVTICDRSVGGLVAQEQMVGPYQVPVSGCAITAHSYKSNTGEAMALGERPCLEPEASMRVAISESIMNLLGADVNSLQDIALSANWMVAANNDKRLLQLYKAVGSVSEFCQDLNICIPVGKDSMSMSTKWDNKEVNAPVTMVATAFAQVSDIRKTITPYCDYQPENILVLISANDKARLGGSIYEKILESSYNESPDISSEEFKNLFHFIKDAREQGCLLSYHDVSDGGVFSSICEMAFACGYGFTIEIKHEDIESFMFNEEISAIAQVRRADLKKLEELALERIKVTELAIPTKDKAIKIYNNGVIKFSETLFNLENFWARPSFEMQKLRDNPKTSEMELSCISKKYNDKLVKTRLSFDIPTESTLNIFNIKSYKPWVAVLREQGTQGYLEMAAAFKEVGFRVKDVHMNDLLVDNNILRNCNGLAVAGGFSYGDALGAGSGWASRVLYSSELKDAFQEFFQRKDTFTLGVCNGCQMLSQLREIIPGTNNWATFQENESGQYESRTVNVKISRSPSVLLKNMEGSIIPVIVSHGEGRIAFDHKSATAAIESQVTPIQYVGVDSEQSEEYPYNPNGSKLGITGLTTEDGRVTIMMPHPERMFLSWQYSYKDDEWGKYGPWAQMFLNARKFIE